MIELVVLDWQRADLELREHFVFSKEDIPLLCEQVCANAGILGAVLLSTCNRTELCISKKEGIDLTAMQLLCGLAGVGEDFCADSFMIYRDLEALKHLFYLCCGMESRIWGDDQILTQVKQALALSASAECCDAVLQTAYRIAITGGKRVKTELKLTLPAAGTVQEVKALLCERLTGVGQSVLVIGNGVIGREIAKALSDGGYAVTMTLRRYKYADNLLPERCSGVPYEKRYEAIAKSDAVISATASPHRTIKLEEYEKAGRKPALLVDLAVPRDIDERIAGVITIDELGSAERTEQMQRLKVAAGEIYLKCQGDYLRWQKRREKTGKPGRFPIYIDIAERKALVIGAGRIALRRVKTLVQFSCRVEVVAPEAEDEIKALAAQGTIAYKAREFCETDLLRAAFVTTATSDRALNRRIGALARERGIPVSVADSKEECSFYFPAVILKEDVVIGVCGDGSDHSAVARVAQEIRELR